MQATNWINFFRRIPLNLHDSVALTMMSGAEIVLQTLIKIDADFLVVRGRMAGTTDLARVVVVPYSMLLTVAFNRRMSDAEAKQIFAGGGVPLAAEEPAPAVDEAAAPAAEEPAAEEPKVPAETAPVNAPAPPPAMPSKSLLLAKLRARLAEGKDPGK